MLQDGAYYAFLCSSCHFKAYESLSNGGFPHGASFLCAESLIFLSIDILSNTDIMVLTFSKCILSVLQEVMVSQIVYLGPSFYCISI